MDKEFEKIEGGTDEDKSLTEQLLGLVIKSGALLFHDQFKKGYIALHNDGRKVIKLRSKEFKTWLSNLGWKNLGKPIVASVIETAVMTFEGMAIHDGKEIELHIRLANYDNALWYDLGDGRAVKITETQWEMIDKPPILFWRLPHQQTQVAPMPGGDLTNIFQFIPEPKDPKEKTLLLVWLVAALIPGFPHPALAVNGPQGSRKSTLFKLLRRLIDPSAVELLAPTEDMREFVQLASHHYFLPLDNLSHISRTLSDGLCRTITGEGFSKREIYTVDDDFVYNFRRIVGLNGINQVVDKPDLLERLVLVNLERPAVYEKEQRLFEKFEQARPMLLGALLSAVVKALQAVKNQTEVAGLESYRMSDFARWGCAVASALGLNSQDFVAALQGNLEQQNAEVIDASPVAQVIVEFMNDKTEPVEDTPTNLLEQFKGMAPELKIDTNTKEFPKTPSWLWKRMVRVKTNLQTMGIDIERAKDGQRLIKITKQQIPIDEGPDEQGYSFEELAQKLDSAPDTPDNADSKDSILPI